MGAVLLDNTVTVECNVITMLPIVSD